MKKSPKPLPKISGFRWEIEVPAAVRWSALQRGANSIIQGMVREWMKLLNRQDSSEGACQRFLAENAGVFLQRQQNYPVSISKIRLGAEFVTDLVLVENCYSNGAKYHLIELESPSDLLFTKKGTASQALLSAIHQVISWKTWINEHRGEAQRLFPSLMHGYEGDSVFTYTIVIGRRERNLEMLKRRRELAASLGIFIRSFDSMADGVSNGFFHDTLDAISGDHDPRFDQTDYSEMANPFHRALSDPEWRELVRGEWDVGHFYYNVGAKYRKLARSSRHLVTFRKWAKKYGHLPPALRANVIARGEIKIRKKSHKGRA